MSKRINLALLLDGSNKKPATDYKPKTSTSAYKSYYVEKTQATQVTQTPQLQQTATTTTPTSGPAYSALDCPCFPLTNISDLREPLPRFETKEQVQTFCKIPELLANLHPCALRICNGRPDLFPGISFLEGPHEYWLSEDVYNRLCKIAENADVQRWNRHRFHGSVTKMAGKCFSPFDEAASINCVLGSSNYNSPHYEYYEMTPNQISCQYLSGNLLGTLLHYLIELFFNGYGSVIPPQLKDKAWSQFELFYVTEIRNKYIPFMTELRVYDFEFDIAGSIDGVFISCEEWQRSRQENREPILTLFDWKRTKNFHEKSFRGEMAMAPLQHMPDTNVSKYFVQLNIYREIIHRNTPYRVNAMYLVRFHPTSPSYEMKQVPMLNQETNDLFQLRKAELELARGL